MTAAAARVSPGGLGDGAWVKCWRKEMWASVSAVMVSRMVWEFILRRELSSLGGRCIEGLTGHESKMDQGKDLEYKSVIRF